MRTAWISVAPFYGCVVLANLTDEQMTGAGIPFTNPFFYLGDATTLQANLAASAEDQQWGGILLADDEDNPFGVLITIKGFSVYMDEEPSQPVKDAYAAQGVSLWHFDGTTGLPTLW